MICLRCGYCCLTSMVVIVVDPDKGLKEGNFKAINCLEERCPHLCGDEVGQYSCAVHDKKWYKKTPCFSHGQIERGNQNCRMGEHILAESRSKDKNK